MVNPFISTNEILNSQNWDPLGIQQEESPCGIYSFDEVRSFQEVHWIFESKHLSRFLTFCFCESRLVGKIWWIQTKSDSTRLYLHPNNFWEHICFGVVSLKYTWTIIVYTNMYFFDVFGVFCANELALPKAHIALYLIFFDDFRSFLPLGFITIKSSFGEDFALF